MAKKATTTKTVAKKPVVKKEILDTSFTENPHHGWSTEKETIELLKTLVKHNGIKCVLETGVFHGESSVAFMEAIPKGGYYVGIDIEDHRTAKTKQCFLYNKNKVFEFVLASSIEAMKTLPKRHFDLIFLDSNHSYNHLIQEFKLAEELLADGGVIAFHDSRHIDDVKRVVNYALSFDYQGINFNTPEGRGIAFIQRKVK